MQGNFGIVRKGIFVFFSFLLLLLSSNSFALPFSVAPTSMLPTSVISGESVSAYYTVLNNTGEPRSVNYVKYLPPNVSQVVAPGYCGTSFNLAPKGQSGDSCVLQLSVTGAVNASDPDPQHHLFVCFPGGVTCAGTLQPLNVQLLPPALEYISVTPASATMYIAEKLQFTATGIYSDGSQQNLTTLATWASSAPAVATIASTGIATGVATGTTDITATYNGITSNTVPVNVIMVGYIGVSGGLDLCAVNTTNGFLSGCSATGGGGLTVTPVGLAFNPTFTYAYIANSDSTISICTDNPDGSLSNCAVSSAIEIGITGISVDPQNMYAYILSSDTSTSPPTGLVSSCPIQSDGTLGACSSASSVAFTTPSSIAINSTNTYAYITDSSSTATIQAYVCTINSGALTCVTAVPVGTTFNTPTGIALNPAGTIAYIVNQTGANPNKVSYCTIDATTGVFTACSGAGGSYFNSPVAISIPSPTGGYAYISNSAGSASVAFCPITSNGTFDTGSCLQVTNPGPPSNVVAVN